MADEQFLLSGDQLATYSNFTATFPPPTFTSNIEYSDVDILGSDTDRFFLVRTQGDSSIVNNGDLFEIFAAVDDGAGGLEPGTSPLFTSAQAQPASFSGATGSDTFIVLGMFFGDNVIVNLEGFDGINEFTATVGPNGSNPSLPLANIAAASPDNAPCFVEGSPILTSNGYIPVENLAAHDLAVTLDNGLKPIRFISKTTITLTATNDHLRPVRLRAGSLGLRQPESDLIVSQQHRILMRNWQSQLITGHDEMLCPAKHLIDGKSVTLDFTENTVTYYHLHFDTHEIIKSAGIWTESYFSGGLPCLGAAQTTQRTELAQIFPDGLGQLSETQIARPSTRSYESSVITTM